MYRKKSIVAMLMCGVFMLVAAAPLVSSADGEVHTILKDENGPPSTCALSWEITPDRAGTWYGAVVNYGMRWLIIDVEDTQTGDLLIDREMYRYAVYTDEFNTDSVHMDAGHTYKVTGTPNGPLGTYCTVEDVFVPDVMPEPPVAAFEFTVDGLTVSVDASASDDPDGTIVSWDWDWGDGSVGTGEIATHTYAPPLGGAGETVSSPALGIEMPHPILGTCYDTEGNPMADCEVTVTDVTLGYSGTVMSAVDGTYAFDIANLPGEWAVGDEILIEAVRGSMYGSASIIATSDFYQIVDVVLEGDAEPFDVTITLTVTDNDGLTSTVSATVTLYP